MAVSPDPPVTCLRSTTRPLKAPRLACRRLNVWMKTSTAALTSPRIRRTRRTLRAATVSLLRLAVGVRRSSEPFTPQLCRLNYCTQLLTTTRIIIILTSNSTMRRNSSKEPWSWTYTSGLV